MRAALLAIVCSCATRAAAPAIASSPAYTAPEHRRCRLPPRGHVLLVGFPTSEGIFVSITDALNVVAQLEDLDDRLEMLAACIGAQ